MQLSYPCRKVGLRPEPGCCESCLVPLSTTGPSLSEGAVPTRPGGSPHSTTTGASALCLSAVRRRLVWQTWASGPLSLQGGGEGTRGGLLVGVAGHQLGPGGPRGRNTVSRAGCDLRAGSGSCRGCAAGLQDLSSLTRDQTRAPAESPPLDRQESPNILLN